MPGFVGKTISDVLFFKNRLGFVAEDRIVLSRVGDFVNFFRKTILSLNDDDPVDVGVASAAVTNIVWGVPYESSVILFSSNGQFEVGSNAEVFGPRTVQVTPLGTYGCSTTVPPVLIGPSVMFVSPTGAEGFRVLEVAYYPEGRGYSFNDLTARCPDYLVEARRILGAPQENMAMILGSTKAYPVAFEGSRAQRSQVAWGSWSYTLTSILGAGVFDSWVYLVESRSDGMWLTRQFLGLDDTDTGSVAYRTHVDRQASHTACGVVYDSGTDQTTITPPWGLHGTDGAVVSVDPDSIPGVLALVLSQDDTSIIVRGDWSSRSFVVGIPYKSQLTLSPPVIRQETGGVYTGRLQIRGVSLLAQDTGFFEAKVFNTLKTTAVYTFTGRITGVGTSPLDTVAISDVRKRFGVLGRNTETLVSIETTGVLPFALLGAEWEMLFHRRGRSVA
jgi:hypothetical protein